MDALFSKNTKLLENRMNVYWTFSLRPLFALPSLIFLSSLDISGLTASNENKNVCTPTKRRYISKSSVSRLTCQSCGTLSSLEFPSEFTHQNSKMVQGSDNDLPSKFDLSKDLEEMQTILCQYDDLLEILLSKIEKYEEDFFDILEDDFDNELDSSRHLKLVKEAQNIMSFMRKNKR